MLFRLLTKEEFFQKYPNRISLRYMTIRIHEENSSSSEVMWTYMYEQLGQVFEGEPWHEDLTIIDLPEFFAHIDHVEKVEE